MDKRAPFLAVSLANLCFFAAWRELLSPESFSHFYHWKQYPGYAIGAALALNVLLLASIFFVGHLLVSRYGTARMRAAAQVVFLVIFIRVLNTFRSQFELLSTGHIRVLVGQAGYVAIVAALSASLLIAIRQYGLSRVAHAAALVVLVLFPFVVVASVHAVRLGIQYGPAVTERAAPPPLFHQSPGKPRIVWLIFDELDQRITFDARPSDLSLPEFDRLRSEALYAVNVLPPARRTVESIPALLTGRMVSASDVAGLDWRSLPDTFSDARAIGFNTALAGWYIPYCRILGDRLNYCHWEVDGNAADSRKLRVGSNMIRQGLGLLYLIPFASRTVTALLERPLSDYRSNHLDLYKSVAEQAERVVSDPKFSLAFVHLPVPHAPYIYNRQDGALVASGDSSYVDNLALADATLGRLRRTMEEAGVWSQSIIIVSSDHAWRPEVWESHPSWNAADAAVRTDPPDPRVPFLIKLAGQAEGVTYETTFNTIASRDLILTLLTGAVSTMEQLVEWIDMHSSIVGKPGPK